MLGLPQVGKSIHSFKICDVFSAFSLSDPNTKVLLPSELSEGFSVSPPHSCSTRGFRAPSSLLHAINHTISEILGENRAVFYQVLPSSLSCASELDSFQKCLSRAQLRDWHSPTPLVIRDQHPRRLQLLPGLYWSQTSQPLPWVLLGKLVPNHPAPSYSIKNVYNPVNSNISAACYGGKRSLGEKGGGKVPFHWKCWLGTEEGVSTRKISFDMIKSHNRKCCCNTGLVSSDKYLI